MRELLSLSFIAVAACSPLSQPAPDGGFLPADAGLLAADSGAVGWGPFDAGLWSSCYELDAGTRRGYHGPFPVWLRDCGNPRPREYYRVGLSGPGSAYTLPRIDHARELRGLCDAPDAGLYACLLYTSRCV